MEDRCICCGEIIQEGRQVCWACEEGGGSRMMKNGSGAAVPTEEAAIRNIAKEKNKYVSQVFNSIEATLSLMGYSMDEIHIRDKKSGKRYSRKR